MNIQTHHIEGVEIVELQSDNLIIENSEDGLNLLGNLYYQGYNKIVMHEANITPDFFDLKTGIAGEILQKYTNYRVQLAIVGDFSKFNSKSLNDFIYESNRGKHVGFFKDTDSAIQFLSGI